MENHVWEGHVGEGGDTEVSKPVKPLWVHGLPLEDFTVEVSMIVKVLQSVHSVHFFSEILLGVPQPFQVLSFDLERESFVLINRSILNFIELVKLPLENHEVSSSLSVKVNHVLLEFFKGVNNLEEVFVGQKESIVSSLNLGDNFFNRV